MKRMPSPSKNKDTVTVIRKNKVNCSVPATTQLNYTSSMALTGQKNNLLYLGLRRSAAPSLGDGHRTRALSEPLAHFSLVLVAARLLKHLS